MTPFTAASQGHRAWYVVGPPKSVQNDCIDSLTYERGRSWKWPVLGMPKEVNKLYFLPFLTFESRFACSV